MNYRSAPETIGVFFHWRKHRGLRRNLGLLGCRMLKIPPAICRTRHSRSAPFIGSLLGACWVGLAADALTSALQQGLLEEEINRNLPAAIESYQRVIDQYQAQRQAAATALFRLGECYRKQGKATEAVAHYRRIVAEFGDQTLLAGLSRTNLALLSAEGPTATEPRSGPLAPAVQRQKDLIEQELALVEQQIGTKRQFVQSGRAPSDDVLALQREALALQRQMAALETQVGPKLLEIPLPGMGPEVTAPADPAEVQSFKEEIKLLEQQLAATRKRHENGRASTDELHRQQRELLSLQRKLPDNADLAKQKALVQEQLKLLDDDLADFKRRIAVGNASALDELPVRREQFALQRELAAIERGRLSPSSTDFATVSEPTPATNEEENEVRRIQALIRDSPDLINAKDQDLQTPLHRAARLGQVTVARFLLANQAQVTARGQGALTPLHEAARQGHKTMVELLLAHGADPNAADDGRSNRDPAGASGTPLCYAAAYGYLAVAEVLLANKAEVDPKLKHGKTPLHYAATKGYHAMIERLLEHGANIDARDSSGITPLYTATTAQQKATVALLLERAAQVNAATDGGYTPLHQAAGFGNAALVETLLEAGADVNCVAKSDGHSPLHLAVEGKSEPVLTALLAHKPNLEVKDQDGLTSLQQAVLDGEGRLATRLLEAGARLDVTDVTARQRLLTITLASGERRQLNPDGSRPLDWALQRRDRMMIEALVAHGADVNAAKPNGLTPLLQAVSNNDQPVVEYLLEHGADPNARAADGANALHLAARARPLAPGIVKALLDHRADPNARRPDGITVLHAALSGADAGGQEVLALLLERGADPNLRDQTDRTPLDYLKQGGGRLGPQASGTERWLYPDLAKLLLAHGALIDPPRRDRIMVSRTAIGYSESVFKRGSGADDVNRFTLLELLAVHYGLLSAPQPVSLPATATSSFAQQLQQMQIAPRGIGVPTPAAVSVQTRGTVAIAAPSFLSQASGLPFPDFGRIAIHRLQPDDRSRITIRVNLDPVLNPGAAPGEGEGQGRAIWVNPAEAPEAQGSAVPTRDATDLWLEWGDVVEIPEADHALSADWQMPHPALLALKQRLDRTVRIVIKGQTNEITLGLAIKVEAGKVTRMSQGAPLTLYAALNRPGLLLASSDLARVQVRRLDPITRESGLLAFDFTQLNSDPDLWLVEGDLIEVPEKPALGRVRVLGVNQPGLVQLDGTRALDVLDAIALTGGPASSAAAGRIEFTRKGVTYPLRLDELKKETDPAKKFWLEDGDLIEFKPPNF